MKLSLRNKLLMSAAIGLMAVALPACSDTDISSPGASTPLPPPPPPPPPPPAAADINLVPGGGCSVVAGSTEERLTVSGSIIDVCQLTGELTTDITIPAGVSVAVSGPTFIGQDGGTAVTLTMAAGSRIFGAAGNDALYISRGSDIVVDGTPSNPVIMTSAADIADGNGLGRDPGNSFRGEWGGLVINGFAPINRCIGTAVGGAADCESQGEGGSGLYGGDQPADDSGSLEYLVVKYAGFEINAEDELNGIAFQGVGNGTDVEFIQVHNNADDGVEFFGGTVNAKHVVVTGASDDSIDWTFGWTGNLQFAVVKIDEAGERGIEADNQGGTGGDNDAEPRANPTIANFTLIGAGSATSDADSSGIIVREGTAGRLVNGIVVNWLNAGLDIDQEATLANAEATPGCSLVAADEDLAFASLFFDNTDNFESGDADDTARQTTILGECNDIVEGTNTLNDVFPGAAELSVPAFDAATIDPFLETTTYIGAFEPDDTVTANWAAGWTFDLFDIAPPTTVCPSPSVPTGETVTGKSVCRLTGEITSNTQLVDDFVYELSGPVFVGVDTTTQVTLTIDPGVTVYGQAGNDALYVARGSRIRALGTEAFPVVMTSRNDLEAIEVGTPRDPATDNSRGEWGGLVLNGFAPINRCIGTAVGGAADCQSQGEGGSGLYGGDVPTDNSGVINYLRIQYAGFEINAEDELNGIALQGVGNQTELDFIHIHNNADDGIEFFGGTANASHIVVTGASDDSIDWTFGWNGNLQYAIVAIDEAGERGIEADNQGGTGGDNDADPRSNPTIANFTLIGAGAATTDADSSGIIVREGTAGRLVNGIVVNWLNAGLDIDQEATFTNANATPGCSLVAADEDLAFDSIYFSNTDNFESGDADDTALQTTLLGECSNLVADAAGATTLTGFTFYPGEAFATGVIPGPNELALNAGAVDPSSISGVLDAAVYVGAVENAGDDWYRTWILHDQ